MKGNLSSFFLVFLAIMVLPQLALAQTRTLWEHQRQQHETVPLWEQRQAWEQLPTYVPPSDLRGPPAARGGLAPHTVLHFYNKTLSEVRVCINYYDNRRKQRVNEGWWGIEPYGSQRIVLFSTSPQMAYYAYTILGRKWEGRRGSADSYPTKISLENFISREGSLPTTVRSSENVIMKRINLDKPPYEIIFNP